MKFAQVALGVFFRGVSGLPRYIRDYVDEHRGDYPVYSASMTAVFGYIDSFDYDGRYLTWVMNGYGGRMQEVVGRFSANRDRGVLVPHEGVKVPDLTYLRHAVEPQLMAAAVGRRVDGRRNEYTKIYPTTAESVLVPIPLDVAGGYDFETMTEAGERLRRIEVAQSSVSLAREPLARASFRVECDDPYVTLSLGDRRYFELSIGERVLKSQHVVDGIPAYSANVRIPFGNVATTNLSSFDRPSLLWGIDGVFDWNLIPAGREFATTDHCGRLQLNDARLDPEYLLCYLRSTRAEHGFDRVFRASLRNVGASVEVLVPLDDAGEFSVARQRELAEAYLSAEAAQSSALAALDEVLKARLSVVA
jgi:hypothetical protein